MVSVSEEGYCLATCLACGLAGPKREDEAAVESSIIMLWKEGRSLGLPFHSVLAATLMKVLLKYKDEANEELTTSMKITLPKSWMTGPNLKLKQTFVEHFNKKHPDHALSMDDTHLLLGGSHLREEEIVEANVKPDSEILIKKGKFAGGSAPSRRTSSTPTSTA